MAHRILTGIKPTGQLTLGNYLGVLKHLPKIQNDGESFIFIADLHALTRRFLFSGRFRSKQSDIIFAKFSQHSCWIKRYHAKLFIYGRIIKNDSI